MDYAKRIIRAATLENMADTNGVVCVDQLAQTYLKISAPIIITGFVYVSANGRAMQPRQAGIIYDEQEAAWRQVVQKVKKEKPDTLLIMQLAHTGRQTTCPNAVGASNRACSYFKSKVRALTTQEAEKIVVDFADAALRAQRAGFDGVQIHAAHGYLIHQFLSPYTGYRTDKYKDRNLFLIEILKAVREKCRPDFKISVKVSAADDTGLTLTHTLETVQKIDAFVDNVEVSYGTMEYALNIIRGDCPIDIIFKVNPLFNQYPRFIKFLAKKVIASKYLKVFKPFTPNYNLAAALAIKKQIKASVTLTGGVRTAKDIQSVLNQGIDYVSSARLFICEPDMVYQFQQGNWQQSKCVNCNLCTVFCDAEKPVRCYHKEKETHA